MKFSLQQMLKVAAVVTVVAFVVAFIVRHAKHGVALHIGDVAWPVFLIGALITIALGLATTVKLVLARRSARADTR